MDPLRLRNIIESKTLDRRGLADAMLKHVNIAREQPLLAGGLERAQATLAKLGRPVPELPTYGDFFDAMTGDIDGDGFADFDLDAAREFGWWLDTPAGTRTEQTLVAGKDDGLTVSPGEQIAIST